MKNKVMVLICFLALAPLSVQAQKIFMCKDASGRTLTSDRPIPECADRAVREFDKSGTVRREIPAPLTAEQKRQKQLEEEKRKVDEAAAIEQKQNDRALVARYRNESDIETARKRDLNLVQEKIKRETASLAAAEATHKTAQAELAQIKNQKNIPSALQRKIEASGQAVAEDKKKLQEYGAEIAQTNLKYDAALKRYREISGTASAK
jgi:cell division protein FtsN